MAPRKWSDDVRAEALRLYAEFGLAQAHHQTGVPRGTLRDWARAAGVLAPAAQAEAQERTAAARKAMAAQLEAAHERRITKLATLAELGLDRAIELVRLREPASAASLRDVVGAFTRAHHDLALMTGGATERGDLVIRFNVPPPAPAPPVVVPQDELRAIGP